jgi:hypothetical protein
MRLERIALYIVSSLLVGLAGVLILVVGQKNAIALSVGTSMIAGSLASISFAVIRYLDDRAADSSAASLRNSVESLEHSVRDEQHALESLRRVTSSISGTSLRVYDRHPQDEVREELEQISELISADIFGFTLRPFCQDWLQHLIDRGNCHVRLITQGPRSAMFDQVCQQESRNPTIMRADALWVMNRVIEARDLSKAGVNIELRWFTGYPTVTMTRLNDVMFVRARFLREATQPRLFHERYCSEDGLPFRAYLEQFETAWSASVVPTAEDIGSGHPDG